MAADLAGLISDLGAETAVLDALLAPLGDAEWRTPTPAAGWSIADQVSHLAYFDETTLLSLVDPDEFGRGAAALLARGDDFPDQVAAEHRHLGGPALLAWFRRARAGLLDGYARVEPGRRLPWYGPDMGAASSVTARLMETWAHGQDIADALGAERPATGRLRHIADLGVRTRAFSFALRGQPAPAGPVRVELAAPGGGAWSWGPEDARDRVTGPALDFCLAVTQRRHLADTGLGVTGAGAGAWMSVAQAFAGAPGPGRASLNQASLNQASLNQAPVSPQEARS
jgi:uncharacterized protein (TIGR03084 family)